MMNLRIDEAACDLAAAIDYVAALADVTAEKVGSPEVYDAAAAEDAWARTLAFLRKELPSSPSGRHAPRGSSRESGGNGIGNG